MDGWRKWRKDRTATRSCWSNECNYPGLICFAKRKPGKGRYTVIPPTLHPSVPLEHVTVCHCLLLFVIVCYCLLLFVIVLVNACNSALLTCL